MNTERLYELLSQLEIETAKLDLLGKLDRLVEYVGQQVSDPSNAEHQTNFSNSRKELEVSLRESWFSQLTPLEADVLDSMGLDYLIGQKLPRRLKQIMRDDGMLPAVVRDELSSIAQVIKLKLTTAVDTKNNLTKLGFVSEQIGVGSAELAYRIPRAVIDNRYSTFLQDAEFYHSLVTTMSEIVLGATPELELQGLSSSAFSIFLNLDPEVVAFTILAIERAMNGYKTILEIRVLRDQMKSRGVTEDALAAIEANIQSTLDEVFRTALLSTIKETRTSASKERKNELVNHGSILLRQLSEKMEEGYEVDARVGYSEEDIEEESEKTKNDRYREIDKAIRKAIKSVRKHIGATKRLNVLEHSSFQGEAEEESEDLDEE